MLRIVAVHALLIELTLTERPVVGHCGSCTPAHLTERVLGEYAFTEALAVLGAVAALGCRASCAFGLALMLWASGLGCERGAA
jgi:hypothetical protein